MKEFAFEWRLTKEPPPSTRVADPDLVFSYSEPAHCGIAISTDDHNCARAHVLLLANDSLDVFFAEIAECFCRMFEEVRLFACFRRRHRWRQIDEPFWVCRKAAHDLQRSNRVLFSNCQLAVKTSLDDALSNYVINIQQVF